MAIPDTIEVAVNQVITLNGSHSYDLDYGDKITQYEYSVGSLAQSLTGTTWTDLVPDTWYTSSNAVFTIKFLEVGTSYISLRVTDFYAAKSDPDIMTVNVLSTGWTNQPPVANLVSDVYSGFAPLLIHLDASASEPPNTDIVHGDSVVAYQFDSDDGYSAGETLNTTVSFHYPTAGVYHPSVTVLDAFGLSDTASVTINVYKNNAPLAQLSVSPNNILAPQTVTLDASASTAPIGDMIYGDSIVKYEFDTGDFGSGYVDFGLTSSISHTYTIPDIYYPKVRVTDSMGLTDEFTATLNLNPANIPPNAVLTTTPSPATGPSPLEVIFDASGSNDPDGTIVKYEMDFGDGLGYRDYGTNNGSDGTIRHTFTNTSTTFSLTYFVTLRVTDNGGKTDTTSVIVIVDPGVANLPPVAALSAAPTSGLVPLRVDFDATGSYDTDGTIVSYQWDYEGTGVFGTPDTAVTSYTYNTTGTYNATVKVTDNLGATDTAIVVITVSSATNIYPVAVLHILPSAQSATVPFAATLDAGPGLWGAGSYDPDGTIVSYEFQTGDQGDIWSYPTLVASYAHTYNNRGVFVARVRVTDNDGAQSIASVVVQVGVMDAYGRFNATKTNGSEYHYIIDQDLSNVSGPNSDYGYALKFHYNYLYKIIIINGVAYLRYVDFTGATELPWMIPLTFTNAGRSYTVSSAIILGTGPSGIFILASVPGFSGRTFIILVHNKTITWTESIWQVLNITRQSGCEFMFPRKRGPYIYLTCQKQSSGLSSGITTNTYSIVGYLDTGLSSTDIPIVVSCTPHWAYRTSLFIEPAGGQRVRARDDSGNFYTNGDLMYSDISSLYNSNITYCYDNDGNYKWHFDLAEYLYNQGNQEDISRVGTPYGYAYIFKSEDRRIHDKNISNIKITSSGNILVYGVSWCVGTISTNSIYGPYTLCTYCLDPSGALLWIKSTQLFYRYDPSIYLDPNSTKRSGAWGFMTMTDIDGDGYADDEVFVMAYSVRPYANSLEYYNYIVCFDINNGDIVWQREYTRNRGYTDCYLSGFNLYFSNDIPFILTEVNSRTGFFNLISEDGANKYFIGIDIYSGLEGSIVDKDKIDISPIPYYSTLLALTPFEDGYL
jgi:PKD repeat protein